MEKFGDVMNRYRVKNRISLRTLSETVGMSPIYLSDLERGARRPPKADKIVAIASAIRADVHDLLRMAAAQRESIELTVGDQARPLREEAAVMLLRKWDGLNEEKAKLLIEMLKQVDEERQLER